MVWIKDHLVLNAIFLKLDMFPPFWPAHKKYAVVLCVTVAAMYSVFNANMIIISSSTLAAYVVNIYLKYTMPADVP